MSAQRSSRRVALLLAEINRTLAVIETNGQAGSTAHAKLLAQKMELMGLRKNSKNPKPVCAGEPEPGEKRAGPTFTPWSEETSQGPTHELPKMPRIAPCKRCGHLFNYSKWPAETICLPVSPWHVLPEKPHSSI